MSEPKEKVDDGNLKIHQLVDRRGLDSRRGKSLGKLFPQVLHASMVPLDRDPWKDAPMIILKHRWMKNRNLVAGVTTVSFNEEGIAKVRDIGNARLDVQQLLRQYPALIEVIGDQNSSPRPPEEPPKAVLTPDPPPAAAPKKMAPEPTVEVVEDDVAEAEESSEEASPEDPSAPKRKAPPKRKK